MQTDNRLVLNIVPERPMFLHARPDARRRADDPVLIVEIAGYPTLTYLEGTADELHLFAERLMTMLDVLDRQTVDIVAGSDDLVWVRRAIRTAMDEGGDR